MSQIPWLENNHPLFPATHRALSYPNGLLAAGGQLTVEWLFNSYQRGIFPWFSDDEPIMWWTPSPRMVLKPASLHLGRTLKKALKKNPFDEITFNLAFDQVIAYCSAVPRQDQGTWITDEMILAYQQAFRSGLAHSVEVWRDGSLIGGLYGIAIGSIFFGESMFSLEPNGSKYALIALVKSQPRLSLIDCQMHTPYLESMGAQEIPRRDFELLLQRGVGETQLQSDPLSQLDWSQRLVPEDL